MQIEKQTKLLSLLESATDDELNFIIEKVGGSKINIERKQKEEQLIKNFNISIIENIIRAFCPNIQKRRVYVDEIITEVKDKTHFDSKLFRELKITNKSELKRWLIDNHPDRNGDNDLYIQVLNEIRR